jgi:tripartite-type tricarboxylate transporter receptor subunit TctC
VPIISETVPGYEANVSFGLFALKSTPREIVQKINTDVRQIVGDPEFHKRFLDRYVVQPVPGPLEEYADYLRKDSARWARVIEAANLKIE